MVNTNRWRKKTKTSCDVFCPRCGRIGQLKHRRIHGRYYGYVDHYGSHNRIGGFHGKYIRSCYVGSSKKITVKNNRVV